MSLLKTTVLPTLTGMHEACIKSFREVTNDKGGYVEVIFKLEDRDYTYCMFPTQVEYVASALRNQLGHQDEVVTLEQLLQEGTTTPIKIWFKYNENIGRMNVAFHEARTQEEAVEL